MGSARERPSLWRWSMFAVTYQSAVWGGLSAVVACVVLMFSQLQSLQVMGPTLFLLAAMVALGELRPVVFSSTYEADGVPMSSAFVFTALYLWGVVPALVLQAFAVLISEVLQHKAAWKLFFNIGQYALSVSAAWLVLVAAGVSTDMSDGRSTFSASDLGWVVVSWFAYHFVNLTLVSGLAKYYGQSWWESFTDDLWYYTFSTVAVLALVPFIVVMAATSWQFIPLLLLPLFGVYKLAAVSKSREREALHDALTQLPNRTLFSQSMAETLEIAARDDSTVAVFLLDLDRFKEVNDTLGHPAGDQLLEVVARRVLSAVRPDDVVARLGGDEFAVLLPDVRDAGHAIEVAERIRRILAEPFRLEGVLVDVDVSIGIAVSPQDGTEVESLMRRADVAMYVAKGEQTGIEVYDIARDPNSPQRLGTVTALREALDRGQLELHYQPKVDLADGAVVGAEALVRWRHPDRGLIAPDDFVPLAERTGLVHRLTKYVLESALDQVAQWWASGLHVPVAINVSMRDLQEADLAFLVTRALDRHGLPPEALVLEVTESVLVMDPGQAVATLRDLAEVGVSSSLDDFGTGYSSLVLLEQLPVSEVKIDRSFVRRLDEVGGDPAMVRSIIGFAHGLGLTVVAEGVETASAWKMLRDMGCDVAQGFRVARPMPPGEASQWFMERVVRHADHAAGTARSELAGEGPFVPGMSPPVVPVTG
ncbi:MAG TPA: EAL domain-containing protein [Candidatus Nanopelagicales bacterium]|jgi:diguanylate cyclase (GGDEF)-like protein